MSPEGGAPVASQSADHATYEHVLKQPSQPDTFHRIAFASGRLATSTEQQLDSGRQLKIECSDYEWLNATTLRVTARTLKQVSGEQRVTTDASGATHEWKPEFGSDGAKLYATAFQNSDDVRVRSRHESDTRIRPGRLRQGLSRARASSTA